MIQLGDVVQAADAAVGAEEGYGLVLERGDDFFACFIGEKVGALDDAA